MEFSSTWMPLFVVYVWWGLTAFGRCLGQWPGHRATALAELPWIMEATCRRLLSVPITNSIINKLDFRNPFVRRGCGIFVSAYLIAPRRQNRGLVDIFPCLLFKHRSLPVGLQWMSGWCFIGVPNGPFLQNVRSQTFSSKLKFYFECLLCDWNSR